MSESLSDPDRPSQADSSQLSAPGGPFPDPIPGVIPFGTTSLFVGSPHAGKTIELTDLAVRLRDGRSFCGHSTNKQAVGIITTDHRWEHDQGYWFSLAGWPDIPRVSLRDKDIGQITWHLFKSDIHERTRILRLALVKLALPPGGTVLIDVGQPFITNKINDYGEVSAGLNTMSDVTYGEFSLSTVATGHMGKQKEGQQYKTVHERIAGSVGMVGFTDQMFSLEAPTEDEPYNVLGISSRRIKPETHCFVHDPTTGLFIPYEGLKPEGENADNDRPTQILRLIPEQGSIEGSELCELARARFGISQKTFYRDLRTLLERRLVVKNAWNHYERRPPS
jgi:hypothetical protein